MFLGTLLIGLAMLSFEILSIRTMGFVLGSGYIYFTIALAMLAISAAGSCVSLLQWHPNDRQREHALFGSCVTLALLIVGTYYTTVWLKDRMNAEILQEGMHSGLQGAVLLLGSSRIWIAFWLGLILSGPYFLFGFIVAFLFRTLDEKLYPRLYFADLVGGSVGCIVAYWFMEYTTYAVSIMFPPLCCLGAGIAYIRARSLKAAWVAAGVGVVLFSVYGIGPLQSSIEPRPELHELAKDYNYRGRVEEMWHAWNSFSRISAVRRMNATGILEQLMAFGNGEAHAVLKEYRPEGYDGWDYQPSRLATALGTPKRVLVLFAGVGADMLGIDYYARGKSDITGVELNRTMIEGAKSLLGFGLKDFYHKENIHLHAAEARAFLESDRQKYDVVLLSWSGASMVYYDGSISSTAQYVFTREAMERILDHLNPNGFAVYLSTNKVNVLATLRRIMEARGLPHPERAVVVLFPRRQGVLRWDTLWDSNPAFVKPSGFSRQEVESIRTAAEALDMAVAYAPYASSLPADSRVYETLLTHAVLAEALDALGKRANMRFGVPTDDRPFAYDLFRTSRYVTRDFWQRAFTVSMDTLFERYRAYYLLFVAVIVVGAVVLILGPLLLKSGLRTNRWTVNHLLFFATLGAGFMLMEVGIMQKMRLLFGNPGLSIAVVLAALIFFTGIGSLASAWLFERGLTFPKATTALLIYGGMLAVMAEAWLKMALAWPLFVKCVWAGAMLAPAGFIMGQFMPQGLALARHDDEALVPWGWAINGVAGTIAAGVVPVISMAVGFEIVILLGVACYAVILLLPRYAAAEKFESSKADANQVMVQSPNA